MNTDLKTHWERIYEAQTEEQHSWFQPSLHSSLAFIEHCRLPKNARMIDIGGGDSHLVDALLLSGYTDITVLDISATAIERAQKRLGERASQVRWIVGDITEFEPETGQFDLWHDRATFHFLTADAPVARYVDIARRAIRPGGYLVLGTFSTKGPKKCSGLDIRQYDRAGMNAVFAPFFRRISCRDDVHLTPSNVAQRFLFCTFRRRQRPPAQSLITRK